jgi:hypothetical protein
MQPKRQPLTREALIKQRLALLPLRLQPGMIRGVVTRAPKHSAIMNKDPHGTPTEA